MALKSVITNESYSLFRQLFPKVVEKSRLGEFWGSVVKPYGSAVKKPDSTKISYLIGSKEEKGEVFQYRLAAEQSAKFRGETDRRIG
ncbi:MAG: hypothetical protein PXY39_10845 [archaeon]|nr:hypothetical protein [archaeon]